MGHYRVWFTLHLLMQQYNWLNNASFWLVLYIDVYISCIVTCLMRKWDDCVLLVVAMSVANMRLEVKKRKKRLMGNWKNSIQLWLTVKVTNSVNVSHSVLIWLYSQVVWTRSWTSTRRDSSELIICLWTWLTMLFYRAHDKLVTKKDECKTALASCEQRDIKGRQVCHATCRVAVGNHCKLVQ